MAAKFVAAIAVIASSGFCYYYAFTRGFGLEVQSWSALIWAGIVAPVVLSVIAKFVFEDD